MSLRCLQITYVCGHGMLVAGLLRMWMRTRMRIGLWQWMVMATVVLMCMFMVYVEVEVGLILILKGDGCVLRFDDPGFRRDVFDFFEVVAASA